MLNAQFALDFSQLLAVCNKNWWTIVQTYLHELWEFIHRTDNEITNTSALSALSSALSSSLSFIVSLRTTYAHAQLCNYQDIWCVAINKLFHSEWDSSSRTASSFYNLRSLFSNRIPCNIFSMYQKPVSYSTLATIIICNCKNISLMSWYLHHQNTLHSHAITVMLTIFSLGRDPSWTDKYIVNWFTYHWKTFLQDSEADI